MSRLARRAIEIPSDLQVTLGSDSLNFKNSKSSLKVDLMPNVKVKINNSRIEIEKPSKLLDKDLKPFLGLQSALIRSAIKGLSKGFSRELIMKGVGYKAVVQGNKLILRLGYSHPVEVAIPDDIEISCPKPNRIIVSGCDAQKVGQIAANIRSYRKPEPYLGKGIRYKDEVVLSKQGKK